MTKKLAIKSIILADDDPDDREVFAEAVRAFDSDIKIESVFNGVDLTNLLSNFWPDILFLDLEMPRKNGLQCIVEIRDNPLLEKLPIVVFSSTSRPANVQTAYEMGASLFLIKSSYYAEYFSAITAILQLDWTDPVAVRQQYCVNNRYAAFS